MIVVDASAALAALLGDGQAREAVATEDLHAPHLVDVEMISGLRRQVAARALGANDARRALLVWRHIGVRRYASVSLMDRIWDLRDNLTAYDATYVALAEALGCNLLTADRRLSRSPGVRCAVTVVPW